MFNMGFLYTNIKYLIFFFYSSTANAYSWREFGRNVGSIFFRVIYSDYQPKPWYPFQGK